MGTAQVWWCDPPAGSPGQEVGSGRKDVCPGRGSMNQHLQESVQEAGRVTVREAREGKSSSCVSPYVLLISNGKAKSKSLTEVTLLANSLS